MARLSFRCDEEMVERVDGARGMIPREAWLRWVVEQALGKPSGATFGRKSPTSSHRPKKGK